MKNTIKIIKNLKTSYKLIISFSLIILLTALLGVLTHKSLKNLNEKYLNLHEGIIKRYSVLNDINQNIIKLQLSHNELIAELNNPSGEKFFKNDLEISLEKIASNILKLSTDYQEILSNSKDVKQEKKSELLKEYNKTNDKIFEYNKIVKKLISSYNSENTNLTYNLNNNALKYTYDIKHSIESIYSDTLKTVESTLQSTYSYFTKSLIINIIITTTIILVSIIFAMLMTKSIDKPIKKLSIISDKLVNGDLSINIRSNSTDDFGKLSNKIGNMVDVFIDLTENITNLTEELEKGNIDYRIDENKFIGDYKKVVIGINNAISHLINDTLESLEIVNQYGQGNFNAKLKKFPGKKNIINECVDQLQTNLKQISNEINNLACSAINGKLNTKIDSYNYQGDWKKAIENLNSLLEACSNPIHEASHILDKISEGKFDYEMKGNYNGDFKIIKESINSAISNIRSYILEVSETLQEIANKNLCVSIDREYIGEFSNIKNSINNITKSLGKLIKEINNSSLQVTSNAAQISEFNIQLADGATKQANAVDELSSSIKIMFEQVKATNKNTNETSKLAVITKEKAFKGNEDMKKMLTSMEEINNASESISKIIKVIDDIAFQTNLLALNAAVEAARAGEHGKGFAVVAEEVRTLAQRSKDAAAETSQLIETSIEKTSIGSEVAYETAETLNSIVIEISNISDLIIAIANASDEQYKSLDKIKINIQQISNVTESNISVSEETAASSQELSSQTCLLDNLISNFKIMNK